LAEGAWFDDMDSVDAWPGDATGSADFAGFLRDEVLAGGAADAAVDELLLGADAPAQPTPAEQQQHQHRRQLWQSDSSREAQRFAVRPSRQPRHHRRKPVVKRTAPVTASPPAEPEVVVISDSD
jgi:hypothetical protein